ncbi:MAG: epoxyqueuosine reductase QueH [Ruminococcaceae bacterium]|nr:epoxyqueuosine reductase QueH [Oscillospiraceae bacterium]
MVNLNYQLELEKLIKSIPEGERPSLCLHACCAPCASYCLEYLAEYFDITVYFYNPNIASKEEYEKRAAELRRLITQMSFKHKPQLIIEDYDDNEFYGEVKGMEELKEGGERCFKCYRLRLEKTAKKAKELKLDYFATTLTISPLKNAAKINEITFELSEVYGVKPLPGDFKKKNGYKRSIELSNEYNLYRQNFCGCVFSIR